MSGPQIISGIMIFMGLIVMIMSAVGLSKETDKNSEGATYHKANLGLSFIPMLAGAAGVFLFSESKLKGSYCNK